METNGLHRADPLKPDSNGVGAGSDTVPKTRRKSRRQSMAPAPVMSHKSACAMNGEYNILR